MSVEFHDDIEVRESARSVRRFVETLQADPEHRWAYYPFDLKDPVNSRYVNSRRYPEVEWAVTPDGRLAGRWTGDE
jgi:hypothetical protein